MERKSTPPSKAKTFKLNTLFYRKGKKRGTKKTLSPQKARKKDRRGGG